VWTVDDVALSVDFKKNSYLFVQPAAKCRRTINVRSHRNETWRSGADAPSFISCVNVTSSLSSTPFSDFPIIASSSLWTFDSIFPFCSSLCGSAQLCIRWASVVRCYLVNRLSEAVIHCELKYTVSAKRPPFSFFWTTLSKLSDINKFGTLNPEKIWHECLTDLSTSVVRCSQCTLGNPKKSFFSIIIHIIQIIYVSSEENI